MYPIAVSISEREHEAPCDDKNCLDTDRADTVVNTPLARPTLGSIQACDEAILEAQEQKAQLEEMLERARQVGPAFAA